MARNKILIAIALVLLASCAQVGTITGGQKDNFAPKPDMENASPPNASTLFTGKQIRIEFDEFFTLGDPTKSIRMVPPDAKIKASYKRKTLLLEWEEDLRANTTYSIYLDKAIKDITESNDSLMRFVFSTGAIIDSISYGGFVVDAWTNEPVKDVTALLYDRDTSIISYARTGTDGKFELSYLPTGNYELLLLEDDNADLQIGKNERVAFHSSGTIQLDSSFTDSLPLRLFTPEDSRKFMSASYSHPGKVAVKSNYALYDAALVIDNKAFDPSHINFISADSINLFLLDMPNSTGTQTLFNALVPEDSISFRIGAKQFVSPELKLKHKSNSILPGQPIHIVFPAFIESIDTAHIHLMHTKDSSEISLLDVRHSFNDLYLTLPPEVESAMLLIDSSSVQGQGLSNSNFEAVVSVRKSRELGSISLKLGSFKSSLILDLMQGKVLVERVFLSEGEHTHRFEQLMPGTYSFRIVEDANGNQRWDQGSAVLKQQPEIVRYFQTENSLRANWELEVELIPED
jgi:hypothetical protein